MKVLTDKQVDEVLKRIAVCQIMTNTNVKNASAMFGMTENLASIAAIIGGADGAMKVINSVITHCGRICEADD